MVQRAQFVVAGLERAELHGSSPVVNVTAGSGQIMRSGISLMMTVIAIDAVIMPDTRCLSETG